MRCRRLRCVRLIPHCERRREPSRRRDPGSFALLSVVLAIDRDPAQLGLQHLAVIVLRQRVDKAVCARAPETGDVVEAEPVERRDLNLRLRPGDDEGAPVGVRPADDRGFDEVGVAQQHLLDLARIDVAAARYDHVLGAVAQRQKPVFVDAAEVAGVEPAAAQCLGIGRAT